MQKLDVLASGVKIEEITELKNDDTTQDSKNQINFFYTIDLTKEIERAKNIHEQMKKELEEEKELEKTEKELSDIEKLLKERNAKIQLAIYNRINSTNPESVDTIQLSSTKQSSTEQTKLYEAISSKVLESDYAYISRPFSDSNAGNIQAQIENIEKQIKEEPQPIKAKKSGKRK